MANYQQNAFLADGEGDAVDFMKTRGTKNSITIWCEGTIGGGTLYLQISVDGGQNFVTITNIAYTTVGMRVIETHIDGKYRLSLTGATNPALVGVISCF